MDTKFLERHKVQLLVEHSKNLNTRHKLMFFLLLDTGVRVSELIRLKYSSFDFRNKILKVQSLKKRDHVKFRDIPLSNRLYESLSDFVAEFPPGNIDNYIFPSPNTDSGHIARITVNKMLNRFIKRVPELAGMKVTPHSFRHTFATHLRAKGTNLEDIKDALGHDQTYVSRIYAQPDVEELRAKIDQGEKKYSGWLMKLFKKPARTIPLNVQVLDSSFVVGRKEEIKKINELISKDINIILTGSAGVGKSHILENLTFQKPRLILDDCKQIKKSLSNILLFLLKGDKEEFIKLLFKDDTDLKTKVSKESAYNLADLICQITKKNEYVLQINDVEGVAPTTVRILKEKLMQHFTVITTAREITIKKSDFLWNFERVDIKPLCRADALAMVYRLCASLEIQDYTHLKNKVWDTSQGNPRMIFQLCERLSKETSQITNDVVTEICDNYIGKRVREIDMSFFFFFLFAVGFVVFWYKTGAERQMLSYARYMILFILLFGRGFFRSFSKKTL